MNKTQKQNIQKMFINILQYLQQQDQKYKTQDFLLVFVKFALNNNYPQDRFLESQLIRNLQHQKIGDYFSINELYKIIQNWQYLPPNPIAEQKGKYSGIQINDRHLQSEYKLILNDYEGKKLTQTKVKQSSGLQIKQKKHSDDFYKWQTLVSIRSMRQANYQHYNYFQKQPIPKD